MLRSEQSLWFESWGGVDLGISNYKKRERERERCWPNEALEGHMYVATVDEISLNVIV